MPPTFTIHPHDALGPYALLTLGPITQRFRYCPPGTFRMGSPEDEPARWPDEGPQHTVFLTTGFYLADTPVTQALWTATGRPNPSHLVHPSHPVTRVSGPAAAAFCADLGCQLPTEAQWEYACRANTPGWPVPLDHFACHAGNSTIPTPPPAAPGLHLSRSTRPVATRAPNPWGLYDMLGNVSEWCADGPRAYTAAPQTDPRGPAGRQRACRGGSFRSELPLLRCAARQSFSEGTTDVFLGFRLLRLP